MAWHWKNNSWMSSDEVKSDEARAAISTAILISVIILIFTSIWFYNFSVNWERHSFPDRQFAAWYYFSFFTPVVEWWHGITITWDMSKTTTEKSNLNLTIGIIICSMLIFITIYVFAFLLKNIPIKIMIIFLFLWLIAPIIIYTLCKTYIWLMA